MATNTISHLTAFGDFSLLIPDYDPDEPAEYPGDIKPGRYSLMQLVDLLRKHKENPAAVQFLADMLEP